MAAVLHWVVNDAAAPVQAAVLNPRKYKDGRDLLPGLLWGNHDK